MHKKRSGAAVGGSSLLVIFAVLCLCVFSLLGLSTVRADKRLSDTTAAAAEAYYQADCAAEEILARLRAGEAPEGVSADGEIYTYACPVSGTQELQVQVRIHEDTYEISRWQVVSTAEWDPDGGMELWDGEPEA